MSLATSTGSVNLETGPMIIAAPKPIVVPSDAAVANTVTEADQVRWLHEASGLTWDHLGKVFGVSRRAVHLWANGGRMNSINAQTLADLVAVVRELPARSPSDARAQLLAAGPDGRSKLDTLRARGTGVDISGTPWSPQQLLDARHDRPSGAS
jgi:DNA-binding transcriptional regulator YiaG